MPPTAARRVRVGEEDGDDGYGALPALTETGEAEWSQLQKNVTQNQLEAQRSGFELERKMEMTDMGLYRHLRKPVKRNEVSFI